VIRTTLFALALTASAAAGAQTTGKSTIARAEVVANAEAEFARVDANKDGQMSRTEIETFQRNSIMSAAAARNKALFNELDVDKNGQLSAAEFAKLSSGTPKIDASGILAIDSNKDGKVSLAEHKAATLETFVMLDTNKDGVLTDAEVRAKLEKK
jgi:Ca2+-binding EF-hand superfamily protein